MEGSQGRRSTPALTADRFRRLPLGASVFDRPEERKVSGDHSGRVTPVPIPNTEVKPASADGTWGEAPWESRSSPEYLSDGALAPPADAGGAGASSRQDCGS